MPVHSRAYAITDREVAEPKAAVTIEDEIFEATIAVAVEEGLRRLDAAEAARR